MHENLATGATIYLNCDQAGVHLNLSPRTLEKLRTLGGGPRFRKLGRRVMYTRTDLDAWADSRTCESTSDPKYSVHGNKRVHLPNSGRSHRDRRE
jgi:hypothetical protein